MHSKEDSWVTIEEYLLFILTQITGHSTTKVVSYFMDLGIELAGTTVDKAWSQEKLGYVKTAVTSTGGAMSVKTMVGYYPETPIAYKISATSHKTELIVRVVFADAGGMMHFDFQVLRENIAAETLLNDPTPEPKLARPKSITPPGMTPQRFRRSKSSPR